MSLLAQFEEVGAERERRNSNRRSLRLTIAASLPESQDSAVEIHDLSETGILLETAASLSPGQVFQILLPLAGAVDSIVMWNSGRFYGCQFHQPVPRAAVSAALLQSAPNGAAAERRSSGPDLLSQLRDINAQVDEVGHKLDRAVEESTKGRPTARSRDPEVELTAALPQSPIPAPLALESPPQVGSERYADPFSFEDSGTPRVIVIISMILSGLAVLIFIVAIATLPFGS